MTLKEQANKNHQMILQALADSHQNTVADRMGIHESTVSRMKERAGLIESAAQLLAALDLKIVPAHEQTYRPELIRALYTMAKLGFDTAQEFEHLKE